MRIHLLPLATACLALLFTVGCQSNGGPWYNPATYSFGNPFSKSDHSRSPNALANTKPSLDAQPNINAPHGGYTDGSALTHRLGGSSGTATSTTPPSHWGEQNTMVSQGPANYHGGYTDPVPSQYPPSYLDTPGGQGTVPVSYNQYLHTSQQSPSPYQTAQGIYQSAPDTGQYGNNPMSYNEAGGYPMSQGGIQQPVGGFPNNAPVDNFGAHSPHPSSYGGVSQSDPYAAFHQPVQQPSTGFDYNQPVQAPHPGFPGDATSTASPGGYQPFPPPASGGVYY